MKRRLVKLVVFLLLGAIVNVAVAWGACVLDRPPSHWMMAIDANTEDDLKRVGLTPLEEDDRYRYTFEGVAVSTFGRTKEHVCDARIAKDSNTRIDAMPTIALKTRAGWPLQSLSSLRWRNRTGNFGEIEMLWHTRSSVQFASGRLGNVEIPLQPLWPGFAINTVFYAGILWMLFAAPFALRRRRRIRRGLCPACAYPIGESEVCTECGKAVPVRRP